jgi:hypothetical protein
MKCVICIARYVGREPTLGQVMDGVDNAREAVTVLDGKALCNECLHEKIELRAPEIGAR